MYADCCSRVRALPRGHLSHNQAETLAVEDVGGDDSDDWADSSDEEGGTTGMGACPEPDGDALDSMF